MTATKGNGVINTIFDGYDDYKGDMNYRSNGSLIAFEAGTSITYGLFNAQERGTMFIGPGVEVYAGMVVGETGRSEDIEVNVCKTKHLTNTRSSGADEALKLVPPKQLSLEQALDFSPFKEHFGKHLLWGWGSRHLWVKQRCPYNGSVAENRLLIVEF